MTLLQQIQNEAVDGKCDLETILRKCRVLASRLKNKPLSDWVHSELEGYGNVAVPDYRTFPCRCYGHFSGYMGREVKNLPLSELTIPEEFREKLTVVKLRVSVGAIEKMITDGDGSDMRYVWPPDAVRLLSDKFLENMVLISAMTSLPKFACTSALGTVRNRILSFSLELEALDPQAGEPLKSSRLPEESVANVFNTTIHGHVGNVAAGQGITQTATVNVTQGDFESLATLLRSFDVSDGDISALHEAVKSDPAPSPNTRKFGKRVSDWIGSMISKSASGAWKVAIAAAPELLTKALKAYFGL